MNIVEDDLTGTAIRDLLQEHIQNMYEWSPPESVHALDLEKLRVPTITFWTAWESDVLMACGALKELSPTHGEIKSMRTPAARRGRGAGRAMLKHIISVAQDRGYTLLSLETGTQAGFVAARTLYERHGFQYCQPFGGYKEDPNSAFMQLQLGVA